MALHAKLLERQQDEFAGTTLLFRIYDDDPAVGDLGTVDIPDGKPESIKPLLRQEAQRLQALPVGKIIDL